MLLELIPLKASDANKAPQPAVKIPLSSNAPDAVAFLPSLS